MCTTSSFNRNDGQTVGTFLCCRHCRRSFLFSPEFIDISNKEEYNKDNNKKVNDRVHEKTIINSHGSGCLCSSEGFIWPCNFSIFQNNEKRSEINVPKDQTNRRHNDIF